MSVAYRSLLVTAWSLTTHLRRFWYAALFGGILIGSGMGTAVFQVLGADPTNSVARVIAAPSSPLATLATLWAQARATGIGATIALLAYGMLLCAALLALVWLAIHSVNVLVLATERRSRHTAIGATIHRDAESAFVPTLCIHLLTKAMTIIALIGWIRLLVHAALTTAVMTLWVILGFLGVVALLIITEIVTAFAIASIVLDGRPALAALRDGGALLRRYGRVTLEHTFLFTAAHVGAAIVWVIGTILLALPFIFLMSIGSAQHIAALPRLAVGIGIPVLIAYLAVVTMWFNTFLIAAWTLLYLRLTSAAEEPVPWLLRKSRGA
ncbi:hypothetical protein HY632_01675 [Candidatus Uhrbacteria bacterium]|nr:hypothetical protein [Candidatus Uhrbacteria bacterium]